MNDKTSYPTKSWKTKAGTTIYDFGTERAGYIELVAQGQITAIFGEQLTPQETIYNGENSTIKGGANVRGATILTMRLHRNFPTYGTHIIAPTIDELNPARFAIKPNSEHCVIPFRYIEVNRGTNIRRINAPTPFNETDEAFHCDNTNLCKVHDLCKASTIALTYAGIFIDGERERKPYEADTFIALLNAFSISCTKEVKTFVRNSLNYFVRDTLTWPHEWHALFITALHYYYMYTGDKSLIKEKWDSPILDTCYDSFTRHRRHDGLMDTTNDGTENWDWRPIIDWPPYYRYGYDMRGILTVTNALHGRMLFELANLATAIGEDPTPFRQEYDNFKKSFNATFYDKQTGLYRDKEGQNRYSVHGNAAAIWSGLAPQSTHQTIGTYLAKEGMQCSSFYAQFLLEALCLCNHTQDAIDLICSTSQNSWLNMIERYNATTTLESWNLCTMDNPTLDAPDQTHIWSASPLNIIHRYILGINPTAPGKITQTTPFYLKSLSYKSPWLK